MKVQRLLIAAVAVTLATTAQAQVKVGANPGTLSTNAVLDVEGTSGSHSVILQNGNMGIGTITPSSKLNINDGGNDISSLTDDSSYVKLGSGTAAHLLMDFKSIQSKATTSTANTLAINPFGGNVGIGTATPGAKVEILGTGSTIFDAGILFNNTATNGRKWSLGSRSDITGGTGQNGEFVIGDETSNAGRFFIDQNGNVGVGTSGPAAKLEVNGTVKVDNLPAGSTSDNVVTTDATGNLRKLATPLFNELVKGQMILPPSLAADFTNHSVTTYDTSDFLLISKAKTTASANVPESEICVYEYTGAPLTSLSGVYTLLSAFNNSSYPDTFVGNSEGVANVSGKTRITIKWVRVDNLAAGWLGVFGGTVFIAR